MNRVKTILGVTFLSIVSSGNSVVASTQSSGFDCVITPAQTVNLGSKVPGQLAEMLVDRGTVVVAGQIVATLDSTLEQASLDIANHRAKTDTEISLRRAAFETDRITERRLSSLVDSDVASEHERDRATRDAKLSGWRVLQARDNLEAYKLEQARAKVALDRRKIRSPIDGVVVARLHEPGEYIDSQAVLRIVKLDPLHVEAIVPMHLFGTVNPGMKAQVYSEYNESEAIEATVDVIDPMGDAGSGTFGARLTLPNPDGLIPAGVKCQVRFDIEQSTPVN